MNRPSLYSYVFHFYKPVRWQEKLACWLFRQTYCHMAVGIEDGILDVPKRGLAGLYDPYTFRNGHPPAESVLVWSLNPPDWECYNGLRVEKWATIRWVLNKGTSYWVPVNCTTPARLICGRPRAATPDEIWRGLIFVKRNMAYHRSTLIGITGALDWLFQTEPCSGNFRGNDPEGHDVLGREAGSPAQAESSGQFSETRQAIRTPDGPRFDSTPQ